jgi:hypothetical protein
MQSGEGDWVRLHASSSRPVRRARRAGSKRRVELAHLCHSPWDPALFLRFASTRSGTPVAILKPMSSSPRFFVIVFGCALPLVACSGRALESGAESAGSAGSSESTAGASGAGASSGAAGASAGTSPGGGSGVAGASPHAGAGGASLHEPENHRASAVACDHTRSSNESGAPADQDGGFVTCHSHADCTEGENGRCSGNVHDGWQCTYDSCFADSDCPSAASGESRSCGCEGGFRSDNNVCLSGNCRVDADCGQGGYCSPTLGDCGNYTKTVGYYCHTNDDECNDDSDCKVGSAYPEGYCAFTPSVGHWRCSTAQCAG